MRYSLLLSLASLLYGQTPADWPAIRFEPVVEGVKDPTTIAHAADGSGRLFVVEQAGRIRIVRGGVVLERPFLDIVDRVKCCGESGLLGLAFPPGFTAKQRFYVYYTDSAGDLAISRFQVSTDPDVADPSSESVLLAIDHRQFDNHNGGNLAFGPHDGYLYAGIGDGGGGGDTLGSGQNPGVLLGKMLRIDVESDALPYGIPASNPFVDRSGFRPEIWATGLRNPWRFSFDRAAGNLYIGDVGQDSWEEIHFQPAASRGGENYGWNAMEGSHCYRPGCSMEGLDRPIAEHSHEEGCSITGGYVYRGQDYPSMQGLYYYGDLCSGRMWALRRNGDAWEKSPAVSTGFVISAFGEDEAGNLYVTDYAAGRIYLVVQPGDRASRTDKFTSPFPPRRRR